MSGPSPLVMECWDVPASGTERRILLACAWMCGDDGSAMITIPELVEAAGLTSRTIRSVFDRLVSRGIITVEGSGHRGWHVHVHPTRPVNHASDATEAHRE